MFLTMFAASYMLTGAYIAYSNIEGVVTLSHLALPEELPDAKKFIFLYLALLITVFIWPYVLTKK